MIRFLLKRLLQMIPVLIGISIVAFLLGILMPGNPAEISLSSEGAYSPSKEQIKLREEELGLDQSYITQYINWSKKTLKGDLGTSYKTKKSIKNELKMRLPNTLILAMLSLLVTVFLGIALGLLMAIYQNRLFDQCQQFLSILFISIPTFWLGLILMMVLSEKYHLLPTSGLTSLKSWIMPVITLSIANIGSVSRLLRSSILNELPQHYILVAHSKGLKEKYIIFRHAFVNSLLPVIAMIGSMFSGILGGSVIVENIFAINGLGKFALEAINYRDYPALQGYVLLTGIMVVLVNILVDLIYYCIDPTLSVGGDLNE